MYAFILGKNTALSVAEIISVLKRDLFVFVIISISPKTLIIKTDKEIEDIQDFLDNLGGTIKISEISTKTTEKDAMRLILGYIENSYQDSKFVFGVSSYNLNISNLGFDVKKELKRVSISSRFVQGKEKYLSAPEIKNNKILDKGADFILIRDKNEVFFGKTIAIQDYEAYSDRDYGRPRRNAKSGMLPPKVAQIMLNLIPNNPNNLNNPKSPTMIYDPFCGNGTVLQEAILMGYKAIGSDISKDRVYDTRENIKWIKDKYNLDIEVDKIAFQTDALNLNAEDLPEKINAIVSEVYLGPPLTERVGERDLFSIIDDLEVEYKQFLKSCLVIDTPYLILALPFYILKNKEYFLNIFDDISKIGYNVIDPFKSTGISFDLLPEYDKRRNTILYSRLDQIVGREIVILEKIIN
jgi:tRNA G10  N-methylase Trm11